MLESVVGEKIYSTWVSMLQTLVPDGRTHRLSVVVAGFLAYAESVANKEEANSDSAAQLSTIFENAYENFEQGEGDELRGLVEKLFEDAGVEYKRRNRKGDGYSIVTEAIYEFLHWEDMPWER